MAATMKMMALIIGTNKALCDRTDNSLSSLTFPLMIMIMTMIIFMIMIMMKTLMMKRMMIWNNKAGASRPRPHFFTGFFWWHERRPFSISYGDHDDDDEDHADDDDGDGDDDDENDDDNKGNDYNQEWQIRGRL